MSDGGAGADTVLVANVGNAPVGLEIVNVGAVLWILFGLTAACTGIAEIGSGTLLNDVLLYLPDV